MNKISRVSRLDRQVDLHVVNADDNCVCIHKLFPQCGATDGGETISSFQRFHPRFYLPRSIVSDERKKIERVVIMVNGLDEVHSFSLYDELGSRFAAQGVAAVLLPQPGHLNRHLRTFKESPTIRDILRKPSEDLIANPEFLYSRFTQFRNELLMLRRHICGQTDCGCSDDDFYGELFATNVRISLLGYSIGAAAMLTIFLEDPSLFNTCILLSGAMNLRNLTVDRMIPQEKWDDFVGSAEEHFQSQPRTANIDKLFQEVFFGQFVRGARQKLADLGRRVFFIYGASDHITSERVMADLRPSEIGLGLLVLPGINHFLSVDSEWKHWINFIAQLVVGYEANAAAAMLTPEKALRASPGAPIATRYTMLGMEPRRLKEIDEEKKSVKARVRKTPLHELPIGEMLYKLELADFESLKHALELQGSEGRFRGVRLGKILVEIGAVDQELLEVVAAEQEKSRREQERRP